MSRPKISEETRRLAKEKSEERRYATMAANALVYLPKTVEERRRLWNECLVEPKEAIKDAQAAAGEGRKRYTKVYGVNPKAVKIIDTYNSCKNMHEIQQVHAQVMRHLLDNNISLQMEMNFDSVGQLEGQADQQDEPVFDETASGERQRQESHEPKGGRSKSTNGSVRPPEASAGLPLDEAQKKFEAATEAAASRFKSEEQIAEEKAKIAAQKNKDAEEFERDNVVQLNSAEPKRRGRKPDSPEVKAAKEAARKAGLGKEAIKAAADRAEKGANKVEVPKAEVSAAADRAEKPPEKPELHPHATAQQREIFEQFWKSNPAKAIEQARVINRVAAEAPAPSAPAFDDDELPPIDEPDAPSGGYEVVG